MSLDEVTHLFFQAIALCTLPAAGDKVIHTVSKSSLNLIEIKGRRFIAPVVEVNAESVAPLAFERGDHGARPNRFCTFMVLKLMMQAAAPKK